MRCISCQRFITKSASPSMVIGPVCLRKAMPQPKRQPKGRGHAPLVLPGQMRLELEVVL
jgi:hypothetical protein